MNKMNRRVITASVSMAIGIALMFAIGALIGFSAKQSLAVILSIFLGIIAIVSFSIAIIGVAYEYEDE